MPEKKGLKTHAVSYSELAEDKANAAVLYLGRLRFCSAHFQTGKNLLLFCSLSVSGPVVLSLVRLSNRGLFCPGLSLLGESNPRMETGRSVLQVV